MSGTSESKAKVSGKVGWKSPSNIALVKYWGKHGRQYPSNPSVSFTLSNAFTETTVEYVHDENRKDRLSWRFTFEGKEKPAFEKKILAYLNGIADVYPLIAQLDLTIDSANTFPHSSGIASSASAMSALALCLEDIAASVEDRTMDYQIASHLARLGSGSASRSVYGPLVIWGESGAVSSASQDHAIPYDEGIDPIFETFHDDILIISAQEKAVSSRAGHALMDGNPYAQSRFDQAHRHLSEILVAMKKGDLQTFGTIVEKEALTLHALMMASDPPYMLMEPATLSAIRMIQNFRQAKGIPVYFTLDAGPNIHLLYPAEVSVAVAGLVEDLRTFCAEGVVINDKVGNGPSKLSV